MRISDWSSDVCSSDLLDTAVGTRIHGFRPDPFAPLVNEADSDWSFTQILKEDREGPDHLWQLSRSAIRRWRTPAARLGGDSYRPATLDKVKDELDALGPWDFEPPPRPEEHTSELHSLMRNTYAVLCLKKKK